MGLVGVVALDVHHDDVGVAVARKNDSPRGAIPSLPPEHCEVSPEQVVHEGALARVLGADDGHCEVVLPAIPQTADRVCEHLTAEWRLKYWNCLV